MVERQGRTARRNEAADPVRHGPLPNHVGMAMDNVTVGYNGVTVTFQKGADVRADDGLYDLLTSLDAPIVWE